MQIGAQYYTIRAYTQNELDFARSCEAVAKIGYKNVQLSAIGPIEPKKVKQICDDNGLKIVLTHNSEAKFMATEALIEEHQIYGCKYVGLGAMADRYRNGVWVENFARDFEGPARKLADAGMKMMYHNHHFEFVHLPEGGTLMDKLLGLMPAELMGVTADTYWLQYAGVDACDWLDKHADRLGCIHLKDLIPAPVGNGYEIHMAAVGEGNINFPAILDLVSKNGVTEYALVEQDNCYGDYSMDCLKRSFDNLTKMGY